MQYKFHFDQSHKSSTQVRVRPNLAEYLDRKQSVPPSKRCFWFQSISRRPWFCFVSIRACSGNLFRDYSSLVVVSKLASDLCCVRNCSCSQADWRELSFFE